MDKDYFEATGFLKEVEVLTPPGVERAVLVGVEGKGGLTQEQIDELGELARTAGATVVGELLWRRGSIHPGHYLGKGKIEELKDLADSVGADLVITNDELSPAQLRNFSEMLDRKVVDRTALILDIFAMRARSAEGIAQVEMAQLRYRLSRLAGAGMGKALSRLGGGIGTRGPGETKLETDRRHIREKLNRLRQELVEIRQRRDISRKNRDRGAVPVISLVGYTNAGKSTLMNMLSGAEVFVEDKLFATLDTTTRKIDINGAEALLTDTVGFIQKLPTGLVEAFKSTLEELKYADILLHVVDASNESYPNQMDVAYDTISSLGAGESPIITVFNKMDKIEGAPKPFDTRAFACVHVSALSGQGREELMSAVAKALTSMRKRLTVLIPFTEGKLLDYVHKNCTILSQEHVENGTRVELYVDSQAASRLEGVITI